MELRHLVGHLTFVAQTRRESLCTFHATYDFIERGYVTRRHLWPTLLKELADLPDPQVALMLLRYCASFGKLVYSARVVPHTLHKDALQNFDHAVQECFETFMCANFSADEWMLATLSTKHRGLGLRSVGHHT